MLLATIQRSTFCCIRSTTFKFITIGVGIGVGTGVGAAVGHIPNGIVDTGISCGHWFSPPKHTPAPNNDDDSHHRHAITVLVVQSSHDYICIVKEIKFKYNDMH
jgi:hypothetical protein